MSWMGGLAYHVSLDIECQNVGGYAQPTRYRPLKTGNAKHI